jgi:ribosome-binding protein aMBF1 (putative translation factor)
MESVKRCKQCGRIIAYEATADFYSYIRVQYCKPCAADVHRRQIAESMRKARATARERRELEKQRATQAEKENELLREYVRKQAARIADLETILKKG